MLGFQVSHVTDLLCIFLAPAQTCFSAAAAALRAHSDGSSHLSCEFAEGASVSSRASPALLRQVHEQHQRAEVQAVQCPRIRIRSVVTCPGVL